jgi:hypothetical protein
MAMWYRGDCHVHSTNSDGELTPEELVTQARAAGLHFIAATEHNRATEDHVWSAAAGDGLLVILGEEVTTEQGHWLALGLGAGQVVDWRDTEIDRCLAEVHLAGGLAVAAHPHAPFPTGAFQYRYDGFDAVEVWNGPWTSDRPWQSDNDAALAEWDRSLVTDLHEGRWRPAIGASDTHLDGQIGLPQTVVLAEERNSSAILAGLRSGRSWIAQSQTVQLSVTARAGDRTAGIGDRLSTSAGTVLVAVEVHGVPAGVVSLHSDHGPVHRAPVPQSGTAAIEWRTSAAESAFVRIEVRHPDGSMAALANPILLD